MNQLKITLNADDSVSQEDLIRNYRDLEEYFREQIPDLRRTEIKENKQPVLGAKGDASTFWMIVTAAPAYIEVVIKLIEHWNKRNNNLPSKEKIQARLNSD